MIVLITGVFGAMVGSFLNVVIYRLPRPGLSINHPKRSKCPKCARQIPALENIPILSYFLLRGRCRGCGTQIPARYVLIEIGTATLFVAMALVHPPIDDPALGSSPATRLLLFTVYLSAIAAAIAVAGIDWDLKIIPNEITIGWTVIACLASPFLPAMHQSPFSWTFEKLRELEAPRWLASYGSSVLGALGAALGLWFLAWLFEKILRRPAIGFGDVKYLGAIGALLGPERVLCVLGLGSIAGAILGSLLRFSSGDREIPFGPFLSIGLVAVLLRGDLVVEWFLRWPAYLMPS